MKPTLTVKPSFKAYLDHVAAQAEAGATIRFDNEADSLAFLRGARVEANLIDAADFDRPFLDRMRKAKAGKRMGDGAVGFADEVFSAEFIEEFARTPYNPDGAE